MQFEEFENTDTDASYHPPEPVSVETEPIGLDLSKERLTGLEMRGTDLSHADVTKAVIAGSNLAEANLKHAQLNRATLAAVNLEGADLTGADLSDSKWIAVNISGADFGDVVTDGARSVSVDWSSAKVPPLNRPGPMITPLVFMPLLLLGGFALSLLLRWRTRKPRQTL